MPAEDQQLTRKNITIREDQNKFVKNKHLNLSSFVREKLDEYITRFPDEERNQETDKESY